MTLSSSVSSVSEELGEQGRDTLDPREELFADPGLLLRISLTLSLEDEVTMGCLPSLLSPRGGAQ